MTFMEHTDPPEKASPSYSRLFHLLHVYSRDAPIHSFGLRYRYLGSVSADTDLIQKQKHQSWTNPNPTNEKTKWHG